MTLLTELDDYDRDALSAQLEHSREILAHLEGELHAVDAELSRHATDRQRYELLQQVCGGLEKLSELGGEELFWAGAAVGGSEHLLAVRRRVDEFDRRIADIESTRCDILAKIRDEQDNSEYIEDDIFEAQRLEEEKKLEWVIERPVTEFPDRHSVMPWTRGGEEDQRFRKSLLVALALSLLLGLLLPMIDLPFPDPFEPAEISERFTRLIAEEPPLPPSPPPKETQPQETKPESSEEPQIAKEKTIEPKPEPAAPVVAPQKTAEKKGILAFREKFSGLAENETTARLGAKARISRSGETPGARSQRSMVATRAAGSSGGINLAAVSRDIGGGGGVIEGVEVTQATSGIGDVVGEARPLSGGPGPARTDEEIQIVFDRHKSALYRLYNRELRRDPTLKGQIVLRILIEPDGSVASCEVASSDMKAPELAAQVVERVKTFDFGAKEGVPSVLILYPIDFLPAS